MTGVAGGLSLRREQTTRRTLIGWSGLCTQRLPLGSEINTIEICFILFAPVKDGTEEVVLTDTLFSEIPAKLTVFYGAVHRYPIATKQ